MAYTINNTAGAVVAVVDDGTENTTATSLTLVGRSYNGYGEVFQENFVKLLENFSNTSSPANPVLGQLWFNSTSKKLFVNNGTNSWKGIAFSTSGSTTPTFPVIGDFWYDTNVNQLKVYSSEGWRIIGPVYPNQNPTGANAAIIEDTVGLLHHVVAFENQGITSAYWNKDFEFIPESPITGFATIKPGLNVNTALSSLTGITFNGTANNSARLSGLLPSDFLQKTTDEFIGGNLYVKANTGVWIGDAGAIRITMASDGTATIRNHVVNGDLIIGGTAGGGLQNFLTCDATTGLITVVNNPTAELGIATKNYADARANVAFNNAINALNTNVIAINTSIGTLTTEINAVNTKAQNALNALPAKAALASPTFSGDPRSITMPATTSNTTIATTGFVQAAIGVATNGLWLGASKTVSTSTPTGGNNGDFWFQV